MTEVVFPNFVNTTWNIHVVQPSVPELGSTVTFENGGTGSAYFSDNPSKKYPVTWSQDNAQGSLAWSMNDIGTIGPRNFTNTWQLSYGGGQIRMSLGFSWPSQSGGYEYNFTQLQQKT